MDFEQIFSMVKIPRDVVDRWSKKIMLVTFVLALSYVLASSASAYVMTVMLDSVIQTMARSKGPKISASLDMGSRPNYLDIRNAILDRNIFNIDGEYPDESLPEETGEDQTTSSDFDPNARCEKTSLKLALTGTIFQTEGENSIAIIQETGYSEADVYREGDEIFGADNAVIVEIQRQFVVINNSGKKECLVLQEKSGGQQSDGFPSQSSAANSSQPPAGGNTGGNDSCILDEKYVLDQLGDGFNKIISQARLVPNTTDNQMNGFKIFAIKKDGLWGKVGFNNGDIITQVNDVSLKQPEQGFALYQAFQDEREVRIELLRGGKTPASIVCRLK